MQLGLAIHVAEQAACLGAREPARSVHPHAAHLRHVEHQAALRHREAGDVVAAALDGKRDVLLARGVHARDYVRRAEAAHDGRGPAVDHGVPHGAGVVVAGLARQQQGPAKLGLQIVEGWHG